MKSEEFATATKKIMMKRINITAKMRKMQTAVRHLAALCSRNSLYGLLLAVANSSLFILHSSLLMACSNEGDESQQGPQQEQQVMGFAATVAESETAGARATRAEGDPEPGDGELTTALLQKKGFGVYCWYTGSSPYISGHIKDVTSEILMVNQHVEYKDSKWTYSPAKYWPLNAGEMLTLRAYAPYVSYQLQTDPTTGLPLLPVVVKNDDYQNGTQHDPLWGTGAAIIAHEDDPYIPDDTDETNHNKYGTHYTNITYAMSGDYREDPEGGDAHNGIIHWFFHHGMAKLVFNISITADPGCESVTIRSITIEDLHSQGLLDLNSPAGSANDKPWWYDCSGDIDVTLEATDFASSPDPFTIDTRTNESATADHLLLADGKGLLIIPKNFSSGMKVSIVYSIDGEDDPQTAKGTISQDFKGNTVYTLNMKLTPETKSMEIDVVWAAFTTWTEEPEKDHTIYNW